MSAARNIAPAAASVQSAEPLRQKVLFCLYSEVVSYLSKTFASDQAIAEMDSAIFRYTQPSRVTLIQFADDL